MLNLSMKVPIFGAALLAFASVAPAADAPSFNAVQPIRGEIIRYITLPGTLRANQQVTLYAKVPGYLKSLKVDRGDAVKADQELGEIEMPELASDLAKYEAEVKVAQIDFDRVSSAAKKAPDLVTPQSLSEAEGKLKVARARLEQTTTMFKYSHVQAPFDGIVIRRFVDPGAFIPAPTGGAAQTAAIVTIADFATVRVQVSVPELEAGLVEKGKPVKFVVEGLPGKKFEAQISRIAYALDETTRTMPVEADLANSSLALRPGMYATVKIGVEKRSGVLLIPVDAVVMEKANAFLFTTVGGKAKKTSVKLGFTDGVNAELLSGATEQDQVLVVGKLPPADGQAVQLKATP
jgi:membrane fusion protein (multidrug efflux system)